MSFFPPSPAVSFLGLSPPWGSSGCARFRIVCLCLSVRGSVGSWGAFGCVCFRVVCFCLSPGALLVGCFALVVGGVVCRLSVGVWPPWVLPVPCLSACLACLSSSSSSFSPFSLACLPFCSLPPMAGGAARYGRWLPPRRATAPIFDFQGSDLQPHESPPRRPSWTLEVGDLLLRVPAGVKRCSGEPLTPMCSFNLQYALTCAFASTPSHV